MTWFDFKENLKCIDEPYEIFGDYETDSTSNLVIFFEKCDATVRTCKSDAEIEAWLDGKFILILENHVSFDPEQYTEGNRLKRESVLRWHPIDPRVQTDVVNKIHILDFNVDVPNLGVDIGANIGTDRLYDIKQTYNRFRKFTGSSSNWINMVTYEINTDLTKVTRAEYGIFTFLADVGGLIGVTYTLG